LTRSPRRAAGDDDQLRPARVPGRGGRPARGRRRLVYAGGATHRGRRGRIVATPRRSGRRRWPRCRPRSKAARSAGRPSLAGRGRRGRRWDAVGVIGALGPFAAQQAAPAHRPPCQAALEAIAQPTSRHRPTCRPLITDCGRAFVVTSDGQATAGGDDLKTLSNEIYELWGRHGQRVGSFARVRTSPGTTASP